MSTAHHHQWVLFCGPIFGQGTQIPNGFHPRLSCGWLWLLIRPHLPCFRPSLGSSTRPNLRSGCTGPSLRTSSFFRKKCLGFSLENVKSFKYAASSTAESKVTITTFYDGSGKGKKCAVQKLAIRTSGDGLIVRCQPARALPHTHSLTGSWSKVSCRACRRVCFCIQSTCPRSGHDTRVDRTSSKTCPKIRWSSRIIRVRHFFFSFYYATRQANSPTNLQGEFTHPLQMAPSASHPWAATWTKSRRERQSYPCVYVHGASRPTERHSLTEETRSSSQSGTSRQPLRRNCGHRLQPPARSRPNNPKTPGSANASPSHFFLENCGERKMYVSVAAENN